MDRDKIVSSHLVSLLCFLVRGLVDIRGSGIIHIHSIFLQNTPHRQCQRQNILAFLSSIICGPRVRTTVTRIQHDQWHKKLPHIFLFHDMREFSLLDILLSTLKVLPSLSAGSQIPGLPYSREPPRIRQRQ